MLKKKEGREGRTRNRMRSGEKWDKVSEKTRDKRINIEKKNR